MSRRSELITYASTLGLCLAAVLIRVAFSRYLGSQSPFFPLVLVIVIAGRLGGERAGLLATAVGAALASAIFILPKHQYAHSSLNVLLFVITGVGISWFTGNWRAVEMRVAETDLFLHKIIQSIGDGIVVVASTGRIWFANVAATQMLGDHPISLTGRHIEDLPWNTIDYVSSPVAMVEQALRSLQPISSTVGIRAGELSKLQLTALAIPVAQADRSTSVVLVFRHASESDTLRLVQSNAPAVDDRPDLTPPKIATFVDPVPVLYLDHTARLSGGEIALLRLLGAIDRTRFKPCVLLAEDGPLVDKLERIGIDTHVIPLSDSVRSVRKDTLSGGALRRMYLILPLIRYCLNVMRFIRRNRVAILHTNSLKADIYGGLAGIMTGRPVVWHVRDHIDPSYLPGLAVRVFRFLARIIPSYVITNSQSTRNSLFLGGTRKSVVIPSGIDFRDSVIHDGLSASEVWEAEQKRPRLTRHNPIRIGIVGRLAPWKGQHLFLEAASLVMASGHRAEFVIIGSAMFGEDEYEQSLKRQMVSLGIAEYVTFTGFVDDVPAALRTLDILVHASTTPEPFGQVVIEGMLEGLPVVGADGGGVREIIIHKENGWLVPIGDSVALADALIYLIEHPDEASRMAEAARSYVRRKYTIHDSARQVELVYEELIGQNGRAKIAA